MDIPTIAAVISVALAIGTFFIGRQSASHSAGKEAGAFATDLRYIKESVDRIEGRLNADVARLEGRIDEQTNQLAQLSGTAVRAHELAKSAHQRVNDHLKREHGKDAAQR